MSSSEAMLQQARAPPSTILFDVLTSIALVANLLVLLTATFSKHVHRLGTWYCCSAMWILYSTSFLFIPGKTSDYEPNTTLCLVQACLIHATPAATSWAVASFILETFLNLRTVQKRGQKIDPWITAFLISIPFIILIGIIIGVAMVGHADLSNVRMEPNGRYCHTRTRMVPDISTFVTSIGLVVSIILAGFTGVHLYQQFSYDQVKQSEVSSEPAPKTKAFLRFSVIMRVSSFCVLLVLGILATWAASSPLGDHENAAIVLPLIPLVVAAIFGSQRDIRLAWYQHWKN